MAAMLEGGEGLGVPEILSFAGRHLARERDRWLERALGRTSDRMAEQRARIMADAHLKRHSLVLDLNAGSGLLTWECLRQAPEGGTWALAASAAEASVLTELSERLPEPERPVVMHGTLDELPALLLEHGHAAVLFDAIVGRNTLATELRPSPGEDAGADPGKRTSPPEPAFNPLHKSPSAPGLNSHPGPQHVAGLANLLRAGSYLSLSETVYRHAQRLYALVELSTLPPTLADRLRTAEETIYNDPDDPLVNWAEDDWKATLAGAGLADVAVETQVTSSELQITPALLAHWFSPAPYGGRPSYAQRLASLLSPAEILQTQAALRTCPHRPCRDLAHRHCLSHRT